MRVLGERAPLLVAHRAAQPRLDLRRVTAAHELPGEVTGERRHDDAVPARDERRRLLQCREVAGPGVTVGDEDVAKARARERAAVVHERVADHALAHGHGAHAVEGERAEVQRRRQHR